MQTARGFDRVVCFFKNADCLKPQSAYFLRGNVCIGSEK
jgi:hypothetical protein